jgi:formylmethanofuran dehydrogenase subunit E
MNREEKIEQLAAKFHEIYQQEAKRQGDVRHKDNYADLSENIKEFDRVLARYVLQLIEKRQYTKSNICELCGFGRLKSNIKNVRGHAICIDCLPKFENAKKILGAKT